jgi:hypothetical protein
MMKTSTSAAGNPMLRPLSIFLVALSFSIGWGIRGDFGHESGAWIPGALGAIAICLVSGREDWWRRAGYSALFGGLGWGFGGSIAYMTTLSYASSGQWQSIWYGYGAVCLVGGLWAGLGGAGIALPLAVDRDRLTRLFVPLCFVLVAMYLAEFLVGPIAKFLTTQATATVGGAMNRQRNPLYWFDADWYEALAALVGVCVYDLWERRLGKSLYLVAFGFAGALAGWLSELILISTGLAPRIAGALVVPQGDLSAVNPETHQLFDPANLLTNWPPFFSDFPHHLGWGLGLCAGLAVYFYVYGKWRNDSGLFLYMAVGWWLTFLIMPVLLSIPLRNYGGFRLTPPRGDNWAGVLGVFIGTSVYALRSGMAPVAYAGTMNFILGGIAFPSMHLFRSLILIPGHPDLNSGTGGIPSAWKHYQSANWHSFLEQSQGAAFGVSTAVTMALLWRKLKPVSDNPPVRRWTDVVSIGFVVCGFTYFNVIKNVAEWTKTNLVPRTMKAPLIESINLSASTWFNLAWAAITLAFVLLMIVHVRRGLAIVPSSWAGRDQLVYFLLLWIMVIANFERSLPRFHEQRLLTEGAILLNAALASFLVIALPKRQPAVSVAEPRSYGPLLAGTWMAGLSAAALLMSLYAFINYGVYGQAKINMPNIRWGPQADWRVRPLLKNKPHR